VNRTRPALLLLLLAATRCGAGTLAGRVSLPNADGSTRVSDAVIWLERISEQSETQLADAPRHWFWNRREIPPTLPQLEQAGRRYRPHVVVLAARTKLVIVNADDVWHGAFSVSPARSFDLGKRPPGRADTLRFDSTGVVAVRCDIHPDMSAFVVVTPNHAYAQPDSAGDWRLPELPAGRYVVRAWAPQQPPYRHEVTLPEKGAVQLPIHW
jgi:hypothetical protein